MNRLTPTADGSNTLFNEIVGEHYHSAHGALQEAKHVFLQAGLAYTLSKWNDPKIKILEVGFGTGLNFILTLDYCRQKQIRLDYTGIEAFPLQLQLIEQTKYETYVLPEVWKAFKNHYNDALAHPVQLAPFCKLSIETAKLADFRIDAVYDLIYFDAFSVRHQPEMWTDEMIAHTCSFLKSGGVFVTYAITGNLKRALKGCGFEIQKLPGAPGKREMLRAIKI